VCGGDICVEMTIMLIVVSICDDIDDSIDIVTANDICDIMLVMMILVLW
jgi:hypothetical protein